MLYTTTGNDRHLHITNERGDNIGNLQYRGWFPQKAQIRLNDAITYDIAPVGFWRTAVNIERDGIVYAEYKFGMGNKHSVTFRNSKTLFLKRKSIWDSTYVLIDAEDQVLGSIGSNFSWKQLGFNYNIDLHDNLTDKESNHLLPFLLVYCMRHIRSRRAAAV